MYYVCPYSTMTVDLIITRLSSQCQKRQWSIPHPLLPSAYTALKLNAENSFIQRRKK